jgi:SAM-dependent methyltransferase
MPIHYDRIANQFEERYRHQSFPGVQSSLLRLASSPGIHNVLEVGCGTGHWLKVLKNLPAELVGLDLSGAMLQKARLLVPEATLVCASAEDLPFKPGSFDLIFCVNAFHHFRDPIRFLRNARLILRDCGRLAIFGLDPHAPNTEWYLYDYFSGVRNIDLERYSPVGEIERLMVAAGFSRSFHDVAEHIRKSFVGDAVLRDPFIERESTSQLMLISKNKYRNGKMAVVRLLEDARKKGIEIVFNVDLTLFLTVGERMEHGQPLSTRSG